MVSHKREISCIYTWVYVYVSLDVLLAAGERACKSALDTCLLMYTMELGFNESVNAEMDTFV